MDVWVKVSDIRFNVGQSTIEWMAVVTSSVGNDASYEGSLPLPGNPNDLNAAIGNEARIRFVNQFGLSYGAQDRTISIGFRVERVN